MPCTCSAMPELISGGTIVPMIRPAPRMLEASWLGMNPSRSIASRMRWRVAGDTLSGSFSARETVIGETPTREAISRMPRRACSCAGGGGGVRVGGPWAGGPWRWRDRHRWAQRRRDFAADRSACGRLRFRNFALAIASPDDNGTMWSCGSRIAPTGAVDIDYNSIIASSAALRGSEEPGTPGREEAWRASWSANASSAGSLFAIVSCGSSPSARSGCSPP